MTITNEDLKRASSRLFLLIQETYPLSSGEFLTFMGKDPVTGLYQVAVCVDSGDSSVRLSTHPILNFFPDGGVLGSTKSEAYQTVRTLTGALLFVKNRM